jgi:hypothetical protein
MIKLAQSILLVCLATSAFAQPRATNGAHRIFKFEVATQKGIEAQILIPTATGAETLEISNPQVARVGLVAIPGSVSFTLSIDGLVPGRTLVRIRDRDDQLIAEGYATVR